MVHILLIADEHIDGLPSSRFADNEYKVVRRSRHAETGNLLEFGLFDLIVLAHKPVSEREELNSLQRDNRITVPVVVIDLGSGLSDDDLYASGASLVFRGVPSSATFRRGVRGLVELSGKPNRLVQPITSDPNSGSLPVSALSILRDFSRVLGYSLDHKSFTQQFISKLREILSINRIAIFVEALKPAHPGRSDDQEIDRLPCVAAAGIPSELIDCIELSRRSGIGLHATRRAQILRYANHINGVSPFEDPKVAREFDVLGCDVAFPINDRERTIGVALIGNRVTGAPFSDNDLQLIYHLLEELGVSIRNSWLHKQLADSHDLFSNVLGSIASGSLVLGADLTVLHANRAFLTFLRGPAYSNRNVSFSDLPPPLAAALHDLVENGNLAEPFFLTSEKAPGRMFRASLIAFDQSISRTPQPAMAIVEDFTQIQAAQQAEIEASNFRLISLIAKRFAHEIRNSLVPLTTHHQLFDSDFNSAEFRDSLKSALGKETGRIQRFTDQMLFLSQPPQAANELMQVEVLLRDAFKRACNSTGIDESLEIVGTGDRDRLVRVHRASITHAIEEIFMNSLYSGGGGMIRVNVSVEGDSFPARLVLRFRDAGKGFSQEIAARAVEPFFTTRNTGVGLGLTVAKRIAEHHSGLLSVHSRQRQDDPDVTLSLPIV